MLRAILAPKGNQGEKFFRWRGGEVSRVEGFSDAVFAFAVTLLVVSLEVPSSFGDLLATMRGFIAFGICFATLVFIWRHHYLFFRRYGLQDPYTMILNAVLLFVVLFYVYPLKFLFTFLVNAFFGLSDGRSATIEGGQTPTLMMIYSLGFFAVFTIFFLLYRHAYGKRAALELNEMEGLQTRMGIHVHAIYMSVAVLSIIIAALVGPRHSAWAGWIYGAIGPARAIHGFIMGRKVRQLAAVNVNEFAQETRQIYQRIDEPNRKDQRID